MADQFSIVRSLTAFIKFEENKVIKKIIHDKDEVKIYNKLLGKFYNSNIMPLVEHELNILRLLEKYDIAPKILNHGYDYLIMTNTGERFTKYSKVKTKKKRVKYILDCLKKEKIKHNDIQSKNITVKNGILYLIDFQLATIGKINIEKEINLLCKRKSIYDRILETL